MSWTGVRTVAVLELRQRVRATRWKAMLGIWCAVLVLLCGGLAALADSSGVHSDETTPMLYDLVLCFVLGIGLIVAPTLSATSINGDRADATLALLQATALRSREIVVGKLLAAWFAALAFLAVALPFLLTLTLIGGVAWIAFFSHLIILIVTMGAVCAIGLGFSALTARTSASAVLTYLVVVALTIGTPLLLGISSTAVKGTQTVTTYRPVAYDESSDDLTCSGPEVWESEVIHSDRIWWMLLPNPFVALGDVSSRAALPRPYVSYYYEETPYTDDEPRYISTMLTEMGWAVDDLRTPHPPSIVRDYCTGPWPENSSTRMDHMAFWPVTLLFLAGLGAGGIVTASRRLRTPAGALPRGIRLA